ncbi:hypothetical protein APHAL10511_001836 [Amanita phalloides]|nr:hypothetical protein APHAL10511_001836 [Amanita phalloides]
MDTAVPPSPHAKKSSKRKRKSQTSTRHPSAEIMDSQLFFIDATPVPIPPPILPQSQDEQQPDTLLLPAHVAVFGHEPVEIPQLSQKELGEDAYIEYLVYDDHKDVPRYFEDQNRDEIKHSRLVCKHCGAEGDHKTSACTVIICLTCGARNDHATRSCPISKVCFTCGMKGHINATCPNRHIARGRDLDRYSDCERCNSRLHKTNECPSWWRLYEYVSDDERSQLTELRKQKRDLQLGNGGEGYIGSDPWCYNCARMGHWGDDCDELPHRYDRPEEPSAFSFYNIMCGPFYDPITLKQPHPRRQNSDTGSKAIPTDVGKQARRKNMAKLEKREREQECVDEDDWFSKSNLKIRGQAKQDDRRRDEPRKASKITFGKSVVDARKRLDEGDKAPSLLSRISTGRGSHDRGDDRDRYYDRDRKRQHERDRDRQQNRPRYRGEPLVLGYCLFHPPRSGYYAGAILKFHINFPYDYPEHPPVIQFVTDIFHPLIAPDGTMSMASRFRPWRPKEHSVFHVLAFVKLALSTDGLSKLKEADCANKEAFDLYVKSPASFDALARQSAMLSQSDSALFDSDHPSLAGKVLDSITFRDLSREQLEQLRAKYDLQTWDEVLL